MRAEGYSAPWIEAVQGYLALAIDRLADRGSTLCRPDPTPTQSGVINTFNRFALPMNWDFIESVTIESSSGGFQGAVEWCCVYCGANRPPDAEESTCDRCGKTLRAFFITKVA